MVSKTVPYDVYEEVRKALQKVNSQHLSILDSRICYSATSCRGKVDHLRRAQ
jgi:hypothetical protein